MDKYIGTKLDGRYLLSDRIGEGGMAYVYKAVDLSTNTMVAVKILKDELLENQELVRRFQNESRAIDSLDHDNIVKVLDVNYTDSVKYIVMELLEGITLKDYIVANGTVSWKNALYITEQLLKALQHAHDRGIIHRDVKPQNVMLSKDGRVKVMDFGIARFSRSRVRTITDKAIGTVHYISPEQAKGEECDARSDIYSVGVMLYEMCTGRLPFTGDSAVSVALMQISDAAVSPRAINPDIPEGLEEIIFRAMAKEPEKRYQSAGAMLLDIDEFKKDPKISFNYIQARTKAVTGEAETGEASAAVKEHTRVLKVTVAGDSTKTTEVPIARAPVSKSESVSEKSEKENNMAKEQKKNTKKDRSNKVINLPTAILMGFSLVFLIGAIMLAVITLQNGGSQLFTSHADVVLPEFVGTALRDIQSNSDYSLFNITVVEGYNTEYPVGVVYDQTPTPPKTVKDNANIILYVSKGAQMVKVPDIVGLTYGEAMLLIKEQGLSVIRLTDSNGDYDSNTVTKVVPEAGTELEAGSDITIYINSPQTSFTTRVPDLLGLDFSSAKAELIMYGLYVGSVTEEYNLDYPQGTVLSQSLPATYIVHTGTCIDLVISTEFTTFTRDFDISMPYADSEGNTSFTVVFKDSDGNEIDTLTNVTKDYGATLTRTGIYQERITVEVNGNVFQVIDLDFQADTYYVISDYSSSNGFEMGVPVYSISVTCSSGGSASYSSYVEEGDDSTISITINTGFLIASVTDNGVDVTSSLNGKRYKIYSVTEDHVIEITFVPNTPTEEP